MTRPHGCEHQQRFPDGTCCDCAASERFDLDALERIAWASVDREDMVEIDVSEMLAVIDGMRAALARAASAERERDELRAQLKTAQEAWLAAQIEGAK